MGKALSWARERGLSTELAWPQTQPAGRSEWEKPGQRGRQDTEKCPPSPSAAPEPKDLSTEVAELFPVPETGEVAFPEEQGCSGSTSISTAAFGAHHLLPGQGVSLGGGETKASYLQWCPTWSSFQGFFFH